MDATTVTLLLVFSALSSFVQRISGFGFGIVIMIILPYLMDSYAEATTLAGILALTMSLIPALQYRKFVKPRKLIALLVLFIVISFFSVLLLRVIDGYSLKKVFGAVLMLVSLYLFFSSGKVRIRTTLPVQVSLGALSGLMGGMFAMQGPPAVVYLMACSDTKEEYIGATQWFYVIGSLSMTLFRIGNGFISASVGWSWLICIPGILIGLMLGAKVYGRMPVPILRKIVYAFLVVAGLVLVVL